MTRRDTVERARAVAGTFAVGHLDKPPPPLQDMSVGVSWERIGIDLTGRHPRSRKGNYYLLTYIDYFTKFAEVFAIPNKEAETVCRVLA